jgi:SAM-dependent methyltransferase
MITAYRPRILEHATRLITPLGPLPRVLDFGSGDGWFASQIARLPNVGTIQPVDVVERAQSVVRPMLYDGQRLPFDDASFDLAYAMDVLHHCPDPLAAIDELLRASARWLLIKDHTQDGPVGRGALAIMDESGNRRFGIPSTWRYQRGWEWADHIEARGWRRVALHERLRCHSGLLGALTNPLQFMALWERSA